MRATTRNIVLGGLDPDALAWRQTVVASSARVALVSRTIRGLKQAGVWPILDRLWILAGENALQGRTCLKTRNVATTANGPAFTANRGYAGDALSAYIDTGFNPFSGSPNYVQNDACQGFWVETAQSSSASDHAYVGNDANNVSYIEQFSTTQYSFGINSTASVKWTFGGAALIGHYHGQRTGAGAQALFKDGASVATGADASAVIPNRNWFLLAANSSGGAAVPTDGRVASTYIGKSMTAGQIGAFYAVLRNHMTAIGVA